MGDKYVIKAAFRWRITHTYFGWDPDLAQAKRSRPELIPIFHTGAFSYDVDRSSANILGNIFFLYIFMGFYVYGVPLTPIRGQHTVLCHPRWLPTSGLTEFAACWGGAGFEPRTTDLQSGALPLSHLYSFEPPLLLILGNILVQILRLWRKKKIFL
jgi:hypothetical protein